MANVLNMMSLVIHAAIWQPLSGEVHGHRYVNRESMSDEDNPQMLAAIHQWISEGQSKCDEWGSARVHRQGNCVNFEQFYTSLSFSAKRIFVSDPSSVHCGMEAAENKEDKTWEGVTFCETSSPFFQMGAKTWNIDWSLSAKKRAGVGGVNPITMDCKMKECYSAPPQKSLQMRLLDY